MTSVTYTSGGAATTGCGFSWHAEPSAANTRTAASIVLLVPVSMLRSFYGVISQPAAAAVVVRQPAQQQPCQVPSSRRSTKRLVFLRFDTANAVPLSYRRLGTPKEWS